MNRLRIFSLMALLAIAAHANAGQIEPKYKGKPLAYWVDRLQTAPTDAEQREAADAVAAFGAEAVSAVPKLVEMLDDRSPEFRGIVVAILCNISPQAKSVLPAMIKLLKEKRARDPSGVIYVLRQMGPKAKDAVPVLIVALGDGELAQDAANALSAIGPAAKDAVPGLVKLLKGENASVRLASAEALWRVAKHPNVVPALVSLVEKDTGDYRTCSAIELLGEIGPEAQAALPALRSQVERGGYSTSARAAIEKIEGRKKSNETK